MPRQTSRSTSLGQVMKCEKKLMYSDPKKIRRKSIPQKSTESKPYPIFTSFFIRFAEPDPMKQKPEAAQLASLKDVPTHIFIFTK